LRSLVKDVNVFNERGARRLTRDAPAHGPATRDQHRRHHDLGYIDADGYVFVVDRLKDVVIRGGENVYCAEVEAVLFGHRGA